VDFDHHRCSANKTTYQGAQQELSSNIYRTPKSIHFSYDPSTVIRLCSTIRVEVVVVVACYMIKYSVYMTTFEGCTYISATTTCTPRATPPPPPRAYRQPAFKLIYDSSLEVSKCSTYQVRHEVCRPGCRHLRVGHSTLTVPGKMPISLHR
jgi:hypothetical protein